MTPRTLALGTVLAALLPVEGGSLGGVRALAPVDVVLDRLDAPSGLAVDPDGNLFVADRKAGTVLRLTPTGARTSVARRLKQPFALAVDAEARVIVSEEGAGRVLRLDPAGPRVLASGLRRPRWLGVGDAGAIYVVVRPSEDEGGDDDGDAVVTIGVEGGVSTVIDGLRGVAGLVANGSELYVLARGSDGRLIVRRYAIAADGTASAGATTPGGEAKLRRAGGLARDRLGALWIAALDADVGGARVRDAVVKLSADRATVFAHGLDEPSDLAFGPEGELYVADARAGRVLRFRPPAPPALDALPGAVGSTALSLRGVTMPDARVDVYVNDAAIPTATTAGVDGAFGAVVVIAQNSESHLEAFATAARGAGLTSPPTSVTILHDGNEPDLAFLRPPVAAFVRRNVAVELLARDAGSGVAQVRLDAAGQALQPMLSPPPLAAETRAAAAWDTTGRPDGTATLSARAMDAAGNERVASRVVMVDNTPPDAEIIEGPGGETAETVATFRFTGADNLSPASSLVFAWRLDGGDFSAFAAATAATTAPLASGPHRFEVKARDLAGNEGLAATRTFTVSPAPTNTAVLPAAAAAGTPVNIVGERLSAGRVSVTFNGVRAAVQRLSATSLLTSVPPGATTGPLSVVTAAGTATRLFTVEHAQDVRLSARPASIRAVAGLPVTATLTLEDTGARPFAGLATLEVKQAPPDVRVTVGAPALASGQSTTLTLEPASTAATSGSVVIEAGVVLDGVPLRRAATVHVEVLAGVQTALGGRLVLIEDTPIVGARLTLAGTTLESDAAGNFVFVDAPAGRHMLGLDVNAARPGLPIYAIDVEIASGAPTRLPPLRITPPPPAERFVAIDNATRDQTITDDRFPGFELTLPAGVTITGWDGTPKRQIAVGRLTAEGLPVPPPDFPARSFYQVFFGTPMGGIPSKPLPIAIPNDQELRPGESVEIWYYDAAPIPGVAAGWRLAGDATVTADGTRAVSHPGVGLARFCGVCGIACIRRKVAGQPNVALKGVRGGDPVDLATGLFVLHKTDLALPGRIPAFVHRVFNAIDAFDGVAGFQLPTGPGWTLSVDVALIEDGADARVVVMPGNSRVSFARTGASTFANGTLPDLAGAVLQADGGGHRLAFKDGSSWRFRGGWRVRGRPHIELVGVGLLVEQRDRHGNALAIDRDLFGAVTSIMEPAGRALTLTTVLLDPADATSARLVSVGDPLGRSVRYGYDEARRLVTVTDPAGGVLHYGHDTAGRISTVTDARGITFLTNEYDAAGRVIRQRQADGGVWRFDYDGPPGAHTRARVTDPRGANTTHVFAAGRAVATVDALGQTTRHDHDAAGRITAVEDTLGRRVTLEYDGRGNVTRLTDPLQRAREIVYDGADRPQSVADTLGGTIRLAYDGAGRLASALDATRVPLVLEFDALGQPVGLAGPSGQATRIEYARTGEVSALVDPLDRRTTLEYDAASRLVRRRDPAGGVVDIVYDALDRIVQVSDASGVTRYEYDANGNLRAVTDQLGRTTRYEYDAMDRRIARTDARGATEQYEYDATGNVIRVVDRKGQIAVHEYDLLGRRVASRYADGTATTLAYDAAGRLVRGVADGDTILLEYDALNRLTAETSVVGTTRYGWDARGRRTTRIRPDGDVVTYEHDAAGRPTRVTDGPRVVAIEYDATGRRRRVRLPGGIEAEYRYDAGARLTGLSYVRAGQPLGDLVYAYDALDRRVAVSGSLASVLLPPAFGGAVYDAANRPSRAGDLLLSFDANGNLTDLAAPSGSRSFVWDAQDRLAAITGASGTTSFAYDALGRRTARADGDGVTMFAYDLTDVVEDLAPGGQRAYLRATTPDELFTAGDATAIVDSLGSIVRVVDPDGGVRDAVGYEPFGRTVSSAWGSIRYGFTGREREGDDLYYYRARYYHAGLGRFLSEDPLGLTAGLNAYVYAFNDPVNAVDPMGLRTYVLHGVWPDRAAFDDFAAALRTADPQTRTLPWSGSVLGGVVPSTQPVATQMMHQILADLDADPLGATEKLNLVGFSGGGLMSATLAEMLRARGTKVDTVVTMGTPAQSPLTTRVPAQTRLLNFVGVADPLSSLRLHPRGTNYLILATHTARSYTENDALIALVRRAIVH
jgi:RHS repeat-associated protein